MRRPSAGATQKAWLLIGLTPVLLSLGGPGCGEDESTPYAPLGAFYDDGDASTKSALDFPRGQLSSSGTATAGEGCTRDSDCVAGATCFQGTCVGDGALRFSLSWELDTDLDLHVLTPSGTEIFFANPIAVGGELDVDDCVGSECREPGHTHVENIYWESAPPSGEYTFWAHNFAGEFITDLGLEVARNGSVVQSERDSAPISGSYETRRFNYSY